MTRIPNPLESSIIARPKHPGVAWGEGEGQTWTYEELGKEVGKRVAFLKNKQVGQGQIVALLGEPTAEWVVNLHAIFWVGAIAMPISAQFSQGEINTILEGIAPKFLWLGGSHEFLVADLQGLVDCLVFDDVPLKCSTMEAQFWELEDVRLIVHTSGSTGVPRAIYLTGEQLLYSAMAGTIRLGHHVEDVWINCLPLHHVGGVSILIRCALLGTTPYLCYPFCASIINGLIDGGRGTQISLVPTMFSQLLEQRDERPFPDSLRFILMGGAKCDESLLERARVIGAPLSLTWGMTESASQIATGFSGEYDKGCGNGPPIPFARVGVTEGCLSVSGPIIRGGFLLTTDLGHVDSEGRVHVERRCDRVIISGGENIDPVEIEDFLAKVQGIGEVAVVDVPHVKWGQRPVAFIVSEDRGTQERYEQLLIYCGSQLARFKVPDRFFWLRELPRTSLGKVAYEQLRILARTVADGQEFQLAEINSQLLGYFPACEGFEVDSSVNELDRSAMLVVGAGDSVVESDRAGAEVTDAQFDSQLVSHLHGSFEVGLGMNQGHAPATLVEDRCEIIGSGEKHLLKSSVAVFKDTPKKSDAGSVDFVETDGNNMFKTHDNSCVSSPEAVLKTNSREVV